MFYSIKELVEQADLDFQGNVAELMIATEYQLTVGNGQKFSSSWNAI